MKQEDLVLQFHEQEMLAVAIHTVLVEIFGLRTMAYLSLTQIARSTSWTGNSSARAGRPPDKQFDELVLGILENDSNASVRQIADMTRIPPTMVFGILANRLGFVSRKCTFVPHVLTNTLRSDCLAKSLELLQVLMPAGKTNWQFVLTSDES
jgi:hypothetical protein